MLIWKIAPVFLLALLARADKKIELQDIEEDNLKSEKAKDLDKNDAQPVQSNLSPLDFFKNGLMKYFENPVQTQVQQPRYVQQYAVTEPPEKSPVPSKQQYPTGPSGPTAQQAMVGYLSNVPMQIYLVPQYYNDPSEQASNVNPGVQYISKSPPRPQQIQYTTAEAVEPQTNYIEVPAYVTPTGKAYVQPMPQYTQQYAYVTLSPNPTVSSITPQMSFVTGPGAHMGHPQLSYQLPMQYQYQPALVTQSPYPQHTSPQYYTQTQPADTNTIEEQQENEIESPKEYGSSQTEAPYAKSPEYPRYYSSRAPLREDHRHGHVQELPHPNPLLLRGSPPHLAHLPKALPLYRPLSKPVYASSSISNAITQRPSDLYGVPYRKRPNSLLESYIPSSVQVEYLKRGFGKDPIAVYDALSSGRHYPHPRHYERGFVPNQVFQTASGGVTFAHYKRASKPDKPSHNK